MTAVRDELMNGQEYLESVRDDRQVYLDGERVSDVTTHPAFRNSALFAELRTALRRVHVQDIANPHPVTS
ncbi:MAG: hypothetical protein JOZ47_02890 [Kutzneria sp.]|nr:hypothetical protein [Kutzneria sp.]